MAPAPEDAVYITNVLPWRPPGNRTPSEAEALAFLPFVERHIELARPDFILAVGNTPTKALLATSTGIRRMRGRWLRHGPSGLPLMPCFHPAYLLRRPRKSGWPGSTSWPCAAPSTASRHRYETPHMSRP